MSRPPPPPPPMGRTGIVAAAAPSASSSSSVGASAGASAAAAATNDPFAAVVMNAMAKQSRPIVTGVVTAQQQQQPRPTPPPPHGTPPQPPPRTAVATAGSSTVTSATPPAPPKAQPQPRATIIGGVPTQLGGVMPAQAYLQRQLLFGSLNPQQQTNVLQQQQQLQMIRSLHLQQLALQQHSHKVAAAFHHQQQQQQNGRTLAAGGTAPPPPAAPSSSAAAMAASLAAAQRGITVTGSPFLGNIGNFGQIGMQSRVPGMAGVARIGKGITAMPSQVGVGRTAATYLTSTAPVVNPPPPPSTSLLPSNAVAKPPKVPVVPSDPMHMTTGKFRAIPALPTPFQNHMSSAAAAQSQGTAATSASAPTAADGPRPRIFGATSSPLPRPPIVGATITGRTSASQSAQGAATPTVSSPRTLHHKQSSHGNGAHTHSNSSKTSSVRAVGAVSGGGGGGKPTHHPHNTRTHSTNFSGSNKFSAPAQARANQAASKLVELRNEKYKPNGIDKKLTELFADDFKSAEQLTFDTDLLQKKQKTEREQLCAMQFANQQRLHNQLVIDGYERYLPSKPDIVDWRIQDKIQEGIDGKSGDPAKAPTNGALASPGKDGSRKRSKSTEQDADGDTDMNSDDNPSAAKRAKIGGGTAQGGGGAGSGPIVGAPIVGAVPISHSQVARALTRDKPLAHAPDFSRRALNPKDDEEGDKENGMNGISRRRPRRGSNTNGVMMNGHMGVDGAAANGGSGRPTALTNGFANGSGGGQGMASPSTPTAAGRAGGASATQNGGDGDMTPLSPNQPIATDPGILDDTMKDDDWNPCDVCGSYNSVSGDLMVYCDGCEVSVHQWCYGIQTIPEDSWFCDACEAKRENPSTPPRLACSLCPVRDGKPHAFKKSSDGRWVHMVCALYIPEIIFQDRLQFREPTITSVLKTRKRLKCIVCGTRNGACLQCSHKQCSKSFHPMCARQKGIMMGLLKKSGGAHTTVAWCPRHDGGSDSASKKSDASSKKNSSKGTPNGKSSRSRRGKAREWSPPPARKTNYTTEYFFTVNLSVFPCNEEYKCQADYSLADQIPDSPTDTNRWEIISTTDTRSRLAFDAHNIISNAWDESITGSADMNNERRISRKAIGYSVLKNPSGDILVCANWNIWEVNCKIACMVIKFMVTAKRNSAHVSQRRKKSGTLLASHLMDLALSKKKVEWILVCSEPGYPERFWASLGFKPITRRDRQKFSVVSESELNPFRDTVLMMITKDQLFEKVGFSATAYAWAFWHEKHKNVTHKVIFKQNGTPFYEPELPMF